MRLYLVTREDLSAGQQAVQAAHALAEYVRTHTEHFNEWQAKSNTLVFVAVKNENQLKNFIKLAESLPIAWFHEPDRNNEITAAAIIPPKQGLIARELKKLPLALQN